MKISNQWLREWLNLSAPVNEVADRLTMLGLEVDGVEAASGEFSGVVVAQVTQIEPHPNADRLRICQVDVGQTDRLTIVCGADNVREGLKVPCALVGAVLPEFKIKASKLRGVASQGMLCSANELGMLNMGSEGLMELDEDAPIGQPLNIYLELNDAIIDIDLTPNRGDCFSVKGVARELSVAYELPFSSALNTPEFDHAQAHYPQLEAPEACAKFLTCVLTEYDQPAKTPLWMTEKLRRSGMRPISPIVDVTNFVMLELGQPMHAYDADKVKGSLKARWARTGESLELLDGKHVELNSQTLVISDDERALGMAGIMGGAFSSVTDQTKNIILECAWFSPLSITGRARQHGLHTESSLRFERGVDHQLQHEAMSRAIELLKSIGSVKVGPIHTEQMAAHLPQQDSIVLPFTSIEKMLSISIDSDQLVKWFEGLGCQVAIHKETLVVTPPSWRFDLAILEDLIEEIARLYGYNRLPDEVSRASMGIEPISEQEVDSLTLAHRLTQLGFQQIITYSFIDPEIHTYFSAHDPIMLANPISSEMAAMRSTLVPGLLQTVKHNQNRQETNIALFEQGLTFTPRESEGISGINQVDYLGLALFGESQKTHWMKQSVEPDFFVGKGLVERLLHDDAELSWSAEALPEWAHPYQSAWVLKGGQPIGLVATLHPQTAKKMGIHLPGVVVELEQSFVQQSALPSWTLVSNQPIMRRDLSILLDKNTPVGSVLSYLKAQSIEWLQDVQLFDVYEEVAEEDKKSISLSFTWQADSLTPTDEQIESRMEQVKQRLAEAFSVSQR